MECFRAKTKLLIRAVGFACLGAATAASAAEGLPTPAGSEHAATAAPLFGIFAGGANPKGLVNFEQWAGRKADFIVDFDSMVGYTTSDNIIGSAGWTLGTWRSQKPHELNVLYSVPLSTQQDRSLAHVAAGQYDAQYKKLATMLANAFPEAIVRIGWEFNGDWYPWAAKGHSDDYVSAFRRVAAIFKAASPGFRINWCPAEGYQQFPAEQAYPGDDVVDQIGLDVYDADWTGTNQDPVARWKKLVNEDHGLSWHMRFAGKHHKPMAYPEWATGGHRTGDNPYFIEQMKNWMDAHDVALQAYWDSDSAYTGRLSAGKKPNAAAMYVRVFGGGT
jgi:hypothetical protein